MKTHIFRLKPNQDLKAELTKISKEIDGFIITCVGSLNRATLRTADESIIDLDGPFEIVSLTGTLCKDGVHFHISLSDKDGKTFGGHLKDNCTIHTTAEIVIGESDIKLSRVFDEQTGFKELFF